MTAKLRSRSADLGYTCARAPAKSRTFERRSRSDIMSARYEGCLIEWRSLKPCVQPTSLKEFLCKYGIHTAAYSRIELQASLAKCRFSEFFVPVTFASFKINSEKVTKRHFFIGQTCISMSGFAQFSSNSTRISFPPEKKDFKEFFVYSILF